MEKRLAEMADKMEKMKFLIEQLNHTHYELRNMAGAIIEDVSKAWPGYVEMREKALKGD